MAMAERMARSGPWGTAPAAETGTPAPPPPPAADPRWHIVDGAASRGPFSRLQLEQMARERKVIPETLVWSPGSDGWTPAGQVAELASLFSQVPPPPPPPTG
jgi:hypothetical protein